MEYKLPIYSISISDGRYDNRRKTYLPYFGRFIEVVWSAQPTPEVRKKLFEKLSFHLDHKIEPITFGSIELYGVFETRSNRSIPPSASEAVPIEERVPNFGSGILAAELMPILELAVATGDSGQAFKIVGDYLCEHPVLNEVVEGKVNYLSSSLALKSLVNRVVLSAFKASPFAAVQELNDFLLQQGETYQRFCFLDGVNVDRMQQLLPNILLLPPIEFKLTRAWKTIFAAQQSQTFRHNELRTPTAMLRNDEACRRFSLANGSCFPDHYENLRDVSLLMMLFDSCVPADICTFNQFSSEEKTGSRVITVYPGLSGLSEYKGKFYPDFAGFEELHDAFKSLSNSVKSKIRTGLRRLCQAQRPQELSSCVIDLGTALEIFLLSGKSDDGVSGEITYRLSMRAALFLGGTLEERTRVFNVIKKLYGVRSKAVHEGDIASKIVKGLYKGARPIPVSYLISDAVRYCREIVKRIIIAREMPDWTGVVLGCKATPTEAIGLPVKIKLNDL